MPCLCCRMSGPGHMSNEKDMMLINTTGANTTQLVFKYSMAVTIRIFKTSKMNHIICKYVHCNCQV